MKEEEEKEKISANGRLLPGTACRGEGPASFTFEGTRALTSCERAF
jgi:hypothetical protein